MIDKLKIQIDYFQKSKLISESDFPTVAQLKTIQFIFFNLSKLMPY